MDPLQSLLRVSLVALVTLALIVRPGLAWGEDQGTSRLLVLANAFPGAAKIDTSRVVDDIVATTGDDTEQRVLLGWGYFESKWGTWNLGDCTCWELADGPFWGLSWKTNDCPNLADRTIANCRSFGAMQVQDPARWIPGATPAKVIADRRLGFRVGLQVFRFAMKQTGYDLRAALRLYSSGHADWAFEKVAKRCKWVEC